ncbi:TetR family transcriptional regulator [Mycolicibacterium sp. 018/SC-01/001]|uniref:TetR/AcrR family transcriptional regulator n=1 Tax=Mycolicibacterium sp. 018/SC-01/001 TaxID=2592069 RepID=UPI00117D623E|nr:TetR/AcrR family transcriptional regulator [Mycolicibacterium sp. 018/SC-01/001]TRW88459.1 TetR family transcriptional regulator [Mycolicibacterium sp. 018/SC-01/001]
MPRSADPQRRAELLRAVVRYLEERGVADMSLAPMAEALGTSKRMLLYYFGDRGELLAQAMAASRPDAGEIFDGVATADGFVAAAHTLWEAITRGRQRRSVSLLLQVLSLAITDPDTYQPYADDAVAVMLDPIAGALEGLGFGSDARVRATLVVSGLRGLCQDGLVTGDRARVDAAAERVIAAAVAP